MEQKRTPKKVYRPGNSIMSRILRPLIVAMFVQALIFSINIIGVGILSKMNHNAFDILDGQVINRSNYLENEMLGRWSNLSLTAENIRQIFDQRMKLVEAETEENSFKNQILMESAPELINLLRRNSVTGVFLVLTDGETYDDSGWIQKHGLYIRDMDPETSSVNNSDLLLVHAPASVSKYLSIPLDSGWQSYVKFNPEDPESWNYYRKPYEAAILHSEIKEEDLGYWSPSFRPEGDSLDIITYSMPLRDQRGVTRAILGVELSSDYLSKQIPYKELNIEEQGMYLIGMVDDDTLTFNTQVSTGPIYKYLFGELDQLNFIRQEKYTNSYQVAGDSIHSRGTVYGCIQYLDLYNTNTPFENERWALVGMLEDSYLLGFSREIIMSIWMTLGISLILGIVAAGIASLMIAHPITRLLCQLRESNPRQPLVLDKLQISEIDELSGAIETLSTRVAREASKFSQIIDMAGVEIGAFEFQTGSDRVFCTDRLFQMLGLEKELTQDGTIERKEFEALMEGLKNQVEEQTEDGKTFILRISPKSEENHWMRLNIMTNDGHTIGVVNDITQEILEKRKIEKERDYDLLTNLLNRRAFSTELAKRFENPEELGIAAMVMLDLDNLKFINDSYGHDCGDTYIRTTADVLRRYSPEDALVARMSGDEFYVLLSGYLLRKDAEEAIYTLKKGISQTTFLLPGGSRLNIRASAGVAWYPEHATSYKKLLKYADFAMYQMKHTTKGEFGEFNPEHYSRDSYLLKNREEINHLIDQELITFHYQPIVDARMGTIFGYEALMRPTLETITSPSKVLMLAKLQSKLYAIERLTWKSSLAEFEQLKNLDSSTYLFVNSIANQKLSTKDSQQIQKQFSHLLSRVIIEITEEERTTEAETRSKLEWAANWGCQVALDDFGTGYNSDAALLAINPDFVKLDISIVRDIDTDINRRKILQNLLSYADTRGIRVIAEGVETSDELHTLIKLGVDYVQGYYIAKPQAQPMPLPPQLVKEIQETYAATI